MLTHLHSRWFICFPKLRFSDQRKTPQWQTGLCPNNKKSPVIATASQEIFYYFFRSMFLILLHVLWKHLQLLSAHPVLLWMLRISEGHFLRNKEKVTYWVPFCSKLWYNLKAAEPPAERRWSPMTDFIIAFLVSVTANVVSYFVCKWLDRNDRQ